MERDTIKTVYWSSCKLLLISVGYWWTLNFLDRFSKNPQISDVRKIRPVATEWADRQTDRHIDIHDDAKSSFSQFCDRAWSSTFCLHSIYVFCVYLRIAIISLYSNNWLVFITEMGCVYCAVRTGSLCFLWTWEQTAIISLYSINLLVFITETKCLLRGTDPILSYTAITDRPEFLWHNTGFNWQSDLGTEMNNLVEKAWGIPCIDGQLLASQ
jgi:hypothetical protein